MSGESFAAYSPSGRVAVRNLKRTVAARVVKEAAKETNDLWLYTIP